MSKKIKKVGVIGAGVMGATIAAQLANVGLETILLDIVLPQLSNDDKKKGLTLESKTFRNKLAANGVQGALKSKPASFYLPENSKLITIGNMEDDLNRLKEVQWIIEVVVERLDIKKIVFEKLESVMTPGTLISSNTSGIPAKAMLEGRSENFRKHFAITHFFNPPRYMKLLEIVPGPDTLPEVVETLVEICEKTVGKGIVYAKDTPNFVANRIGIYSMLSCVRTMMELGLTIEAVDELTGPVVGNPKSASFRTVDLVGLDTIVHVANNVYEGAVNDEKRDMFQMPEFIKQMTEKKLLGEKTKQGFYKRVEEDGKKVILSIDYNTLKYKPQQEVKFASLEAAKSVPGTAGKMKALYFADDLAGQFTFRTLSDVLVYSANRIPEIADDIVNVDNAMKWGFARKMGPFEAWDALGLAASVAKMKMAGFEIPGWVQEMLAAGKKSFYKREGGAPSFYDIPSKDYKPVPVKPGVILLPSLKERKKLITGNKGASLVDIGDGVACLEFHSKMNALGDDIINMILKTFQDSFMKLKYLDKPVVAAPAGMALGGGCEICLASDRVRFAAETYMGLVEVGVGLLPAGGGCKEMLVRNTEHLFEVQPGGVYPKQIELMPYLARAFETIALAKVATSGPEAIKMGYLRPTDKMTVNRDFLIQDAKKTVLAMNQEGYVPPRPLDEIRVAGENSLAMIKMAIWTLRQQGYATEHDVTVATKVGYVLCGGNVHADTKVSEQYLLDLERETFLSLAGDPKSQARMQYTLTTGKPLRN
jgi:3-hydroxyacyl-CoA dehydrogenase